MTHFNFHFDHNDHCDHFDHLTIATTLHVIMG